MKITNLVNLKQFVGVKMKEFLAAAHNYIMHKAAIGGPVNLESRSLSPTKLEVLLCQDNKC